MRHQIDYPTTTVEWLGTWTVAPGADQPLSIPSDELALGMNNVWQLWAQDQSHLYRLALRWMNGSTDDAAEGLQRAAIKVWQTTRDATSAVANPMGWLTGLVRHTCLDLHREQVRHRRHLESLDNDGSETMAHEHIAAPLTQSPEACLVQREKQVYIHAAIESLPQRLRVPLILRCCHELPYEAIGARLNLSAECVRKRVQEARALLRSRLNAYQSGQAELDQHAHWPEADQLFAYDESLVTADADATDDDHTDTASLPRVVVLDHASKREEQKLRTLRAYVERHPTGWKKQLALADQLCKMGHSTEAVNAYQQVLQKQPQLLSVWLQMGRIYQALGQDEGAVAAYEHGLSLAESEEARAYVCGLIESVALVVVGVG